ncbi:uncharacterized protein LOC144436571 [Glandiceps talaboti]
MAEQKYAPIDPAETYPSQEQPAYPTDQPQYPQQQPQYPPQQQPQYPPQQQQPQYPPQQPQYPQPNPYPPPQYGQQYPPPQASTNSTNVTVVNAPSEPTTTLIVERSNSPTGTDAIGLILAIWNTLICFFPLGLVSLIISIVAFVYRGDRKHETADRLSRASLITSIVGLALGTLTVIVFIIFIATQ